MAINLRNNVTGTGLNLVTNPILKSSATNPVNIGVKTPVNQYKTEDPRYTNKTQVNTQVKTPVQTTKPITPVNQTQVQTQVQTPVNNQSRFIGFQNNNTLQNSLNILQQRQQTSKKKENLTIPTLQNTNTKNANTYIQQMKVVQDFEADVYKNQGKMTKEQIAKLYPEFSNKLDKAMDFQKNLRPIVKNGEYVDETQIRKYFPEFLGNPNLQPKKELEKQAKSIDDDNKKIFNKAKNVNQDLLSYNGKVFANFMAELSNLPNQVRKQYNINSDATDSDIITYLYNNDKNFKQEFDRIQNLELTDQDKARLGVGGMWLNRFNVGVSDAISSANEWYQKNVSQPLSDVPLVGAIAQTAGTALAGADKTLTNLGKLTNGEFNNVSDIAGAGIKTIGGGMEAAFGTAYLPATLGFNVVGQSEAGQKVLENTVGLVPSGVTAVFQNTPLLKDFYNSLDEEAQADLSNEIAIALLQGAGAGAKKYGLDIKAGVAADAIANALQRGKYAAKFQIFVEKGLANDKTGKFQKGALGRIFKEGGKEFEQAMKDNFSRFNEVVEARKQARDFKTAPVDNNNLEDKRTPVEKVKSEIKNTAEAVKEKAVEINNTVKKSFSNLLDRKFSTKQQQGNIEGSTAGGSNGINGNNYSQKSGLVNTKKLNSIQKYELQNNNRMNPKAIQTFEERYGESYGQFMYDRGFTKGGEDNLNDMVNYKKDLMDIKKDNLNKIDGNFYDETVKDMLEVLQDFYTKTKDRKNLPIVENWIKEHENGGLTIAEINKAREKFQYDIRTNFFKDGNSEKTQLANNVYLGVKDFLDKTAKENGLDSLDEINREIMKVQHIIGGVTYKMRGSSANNPISLTDWIALASMVDSPSGLALFLGKKLTESSWYTNNKLKYLVGGRGNAKNRITAEKMQGQLENIAKINDEKARNKALEKFYNTYIKPVKELSEYFDNSVAEFKKQFNEMVEEGTLDNALPDLRESDVKSGKKNLVTSKNQVTIEADEKGNARRKGQISEVDKRNEDNKKGGYDNKPTEPKKPTPTKPKNSVTSKKAPKTNTSEEREQKSEKTAHEKKEEPKKENSDLKSILGDDAYSFLEKQVELINDSRKGIKEPITINDINPADYLEQLEDMYNKERKSLREEVANLPISKQDTSLTPKQRKLLDQAKNVEERQQLLEKWRKEWMDQHEMSDEEIAVVEKAMNRFNEIRDAIDYLYDLDLKKYQEKPKNIVTSKKQETATEFMDRLERENAEDIKAQQSDLFNMPETEDIEAIDNELTARQQEDLKNMPETEDVEAMDKPKNLVTNPPKEESKIDKILKESEGQELKVIKSQNNNLVLFKANGEDRAYSLTDEQLKELNEKKGNKNTVESVQKHPKNIVTSPNQESVVDKIIRKSEGVELKYDEDINGDNKTISFTANGKDYTYSVTNSDLKELFNRGRLEIPDEKAEKQAKIDKEIEQNIKAFEKEKPKNLVTEKTKQESNTKTVKIQDVDKDTYYNDIMKNPKDHPREMFIYKDGNYYYPSYILPSGKIITPENTYWGEVSSEEAARNWLQKKAEEHSVENETKKTERLKNMVGKTAEKYEETLKRIESDNPMQEIRTRGDYFKYGTSNSQMAKAKKEADANAEVGTFKKDVIDGKEGYRIFVSGSKQDAIRAFYEPKTGKAYRIYRGPTISDAKPFTTREVDRIEKFLGNVEKQLEKETKREKPQEKTYITQEWLDNTKPDNDGVIELDSKSDEIRALRQGKESLIKEGKADGKYLQNYGGEKYPQYLAVYIKDGEVYEGRKGLEDQYMSTKQEAVDWLNQKEKDVEHEATAWYNERDYEPLPKTISVESEAEKAGPKRIAPDRVKWQQETYDKGLNNVKDVLKASPVKLYELGFKSDRSKAVQDIMSERKRIRELPEDIAEKQWNELAKSVYEPLVIKDISKGYRYPEDVTSKFPKAQMQKAIDARARYEKGLFTSFSNKDTRANNQYRDEIGAGIKSQDGKPVTQEQMNEIVDGIRSFGGVFGLDMKKFAEDNNIIYVHLHGGNPFLMGGGGKSKGGGMNIAGLYRRGSDGNISISLGGVELVMEKGEDGEMKKNNVNATPEHELAHAFDYMLDNKLFSSQDIEILKKTMNKPTRLINYYNRSQEIVARAVEQYAAKKTGKSRYGRPYKDSQAYWNEENFEKYVKPIVEKNMKEKLKEYQLDNSKKNVISNGKNNVTSK